MTTEQKELLKSLGCKVVGGYIQQYIDSNKEPKIYWKGKPKTFDNQIWGWQIVAHESKVQMFLDGISAKKE